MTCPQSCSAVGVYKFTAKSYGKPLPTYVKLVGRQNGQFVDMPLGYLIPAGQVEITGDTPIVQVPAGSTPAPG